MITSCTDLLEALKGKASPLPWTVGYRGRGWDIWSRTPEDVVFVNSQRLPANAKLAVSAVKHLGPLVKLAQKEHEKAWEGESHTCEDDGGPYMEDCKILTALRRDLEAALEVTLT